MSDPIQIKRFLLRALARMQGIPAKASTLVDTVQMVTSPKPTESEIRAVLTQMDRTGLITATHNDDGELICLLSDKGRIKALELEQ